MSDQQPEQQLPYRNRIACTGIGARPNAPQHHSWFVRPDPSGGCQQGVARYSIGPIPVEPDEQKSPRCPNCNGLVVEIARVDNEGNEYALADTSFFVKLREHQKKLDAIRAARYAGAL